MDPKIWLYSRVSSVIQIDGHGLERQSDNNNRDAKVIAAKYNLSVSDSISDAGLSAYKGHNLRDDAGLGGFLKALDAGKIARGSWLIVDEFSRLTRLGHRKLMLLMNQLLEGGVNVSVNQREFLHDAEGMDDAISMIIAILQGAKDHDSSREKAKNVKAAWDSKKVKTVEKGEVLTARTVMWCEVKDGQIQLIPDRARVVLDIFTWYLAGDGFDTIANKLNDREEPTWKRSGEKRQGKQWYPSYVGGIVANKAVIGTLVLNPKKSKDQHKEVADYYPRVISDKDFEAAQRIRKDKGEKPGFAGRREKVVNPLKGLAKCAGCGHSLAIWTFVPKRKNGTTPHTRSLVCHQHGCGLYRKYWKFDDVLDKVMDALREKVRLSPDPLEIDRSQEVALMEAKLAELQSEMVNAVNNSARAKTATIATIWNNKIEELDAEITALEKEMETLKVATDRDHEAAVAWRELADLMAPIRRAHREGTLQVLKPEEIDWNDKSVNWEKSVSMSEAILRANLRLKKAGGLKAGKKLEFTPGEIRQHLRNALESVTVDCVAKDISLQVKVHVH